MYRISVFPLISGVRVASGTSCRVCQFTQPLPPTLYLGFALKVLLFYQSPLHYSSHTRFPPGASAGASRHHYHSQFSRTDRRTSLVGNATAKMRFSWDNKNGGGTGIGETGESEDWTYKKVSLGIQPTSLHSSTLQVASNMKL